MSKSAHDVETLTEENLWFLPQFAENLFREKNTVKDAGFFKVRLLMLRSPNVYLLALSFIFTNSFL